MSTQQATAEQDRPVSSTGAECLRVVDEKQEILCSRKAVTEVLVRNVFGLFAVPLCRRCTNEHRNFYQALRRKPQGTSSRSDSAHQRSLTTGQA